MMLADAFAFFHGAQVLVIDLDAQANCGQMLLSYSGLKTADTGKKTITQWVDCLSRGVNADFFECITARACGLQEVRFGTKAKISGPQPGQISIVPSTPKLRFSELGFDHRSYDPQDRSAPRKEMVAHLGKAIHSIRGTYDFILFDCPPGFTTLSQAALCLADGIVTPMLEDPVSVWSLIALRDFGLKQELGIWQRETHRVLYSRVNRRGAEDEKTRLRNDVGLQFNCLSVSIPDATQAIRWAQRTDIENFRTFRDKYGQLASTVEQLGNETAQFLGSLGDKK
jgi:cellulose biosynthesis protein BcsQ